MCKTSFVFGQWCLYSKFCFFCFLFTRLMTFWIKLGSSNAITHVARILGFSILLIKCYRGLIVCLLFELLNGWFNERWNCLPLTQVHKKFLVIDLQSNIHRTYELILQHFMKDDYTKWDVTIVLWREKEDARFYNHSLASQPRPNGGTPKDGSAVSDRRNYSPPHIAAIRQHS